MTTDSPSSCPLSPFETSIQSEEIIALPSSTSPSQPINIFHRHNTRYSGSANVNQCHRIITPLPNSVINKIAAGEVIHRPVNAIKELLENSLDAEATNIQIIIEDGGLTSIMMIDNGHGISKYNAQLLCKRHTTSKLSTSDDLRRVRTFGFRGEALASISSISRVQVTTLNKTTDKMGWLATYKAGKLESEPQTKYAAQGTKIYIDKIFDDIPIRKQALNSPSEERKLIAHLVTRYAIHNCNKVTMSLREANASSDLVCSNAPKTLKSCIGSFFGPEIEKNSSELTINNETYGFEVECDELKKDIDALMTEYMNTKTSRPFVYIGLQVQPADIDVNVHPAKSCVTLHYQNELVELIVKALKEKLNDNQSSKSVNLNDSFSQPTLSEITGSQLRRKRPYSSSTITLEDETRLRILAPEVNLPTPPKRPSNLVHNHHSERKLTELYNKDSDPMILSYSEMSRKPSRAHDFSNNRSPATQRRETKRSLKLASVQNLRHEVGNCSDPAMTGFLRETVFVGSFNSDHALVQSSTKLYVLKLQDLLKELYYQLYLYDFGNFGVIDITSKNDLSDIITPYITQLSQSTKRLEYFSTQSIIEKLIHHADMLEDYFSISINPSSITKLPCLVPGEEPNYEYLGKFLVHLVNFVDWENEQECFKTIGRTIAEFYATPPPDLDKDTAHRQYNILIERKLFPLMKQYLFVPRSSIQQGNFYQISDTTELYKVFERC